MWTKWIWLVPLLGYLIFTKGCGLENDDGESQSAESADPRASVQGLTDLSFRTDEDVILFGNLSENADPNDGVSYYIERQPRLGTVTLTKDTGNFSYSPFSNINGEDSFVVYSSKLGEDSSQATIGVVIEPVNDAPLAQDGTLQARASISIFLPPFPTEGQLQASDPEGDSFTFSILTEPQRGTLTLKDSATGVFSFRPRAFVNGQTDTFTFQATDSKGRRSPPATITVTIGN